MGNIFGRLIVLELDECSNCKFMTSAALYCLDIYYFTQGQLTKECSIDNLTWWSEEGDFIWSIVICKADGS